MEVHVSMEEEGWREEGWREEGLEERKEKERERRRRGMDDFSLHGLPPILLFLFYASLLPRLLYVQQLAPYILGPVGSSVSLKFRR